MKISRRVVALGVAAALTTGLGASPALASTAATNSTATTTTVAPVLISSASTATTSSFGGALSSSTAPASAPASTEQISLKPFIDALKRYSKPLYDGLKSAVKKGYASFKAFWGKIPGWIKSLASGLGLPAIYDWLKSHSW